jgi:rhamnosyl/mannosyltransferase
MRGVDAVLAIVGDGPMRRQLELTARENGVSDRVHVLGQLDDAELAGAYRAADLFVFPSLAESEAFGLAQLEAMASGVPVINTALRSGVPFVSRDGETGLTVPPADPKALAAAIRSLLAAPERRRAMGEAARQRVAEDFSKEKMSSKTLALYEELLRSGVAV